MSSLSTQLFIGRPLFSTHVTQLMQQRGDTGFTLAPALKRSAEKGFTGLDGTGGFDRPIGFVEADAPNARAVMDSANLPINNPIKRLLLGGMAMSIDAISPNGSTPAMLKPVATPAKAASSSPGAAPAKAAPTATDAAPTSSASDAASVRNAAQSASSGASAGSAAAAETLVGGYTDTVAGTQYSGSVEESGGQYVASVPALSGATASGSSEMAAEINLTLRIDELV